MIIEQFQCVAFYLALLFINACLRSRGPTPEFADDGEKESILLVGTTTPFAPGYFRRQAHIFGVTWKANWGFSVHLTTCFVW